MSSNSLWEALKIMQLGPAMFSRITPLRIGGYSAISVMNCIRPESDNGTSDWTEDQYYAGNVKMKVAFENTARHGQAPKVNSHSAYIFFL